MRNVARALLALVLACALPGCGGGKPAAGSPGEVVLFCSLDQLFAEPIWMAFEKKTGIKVKPQCDSEASKTVGLTTRLAARKDHPECDVFWNNEVGQTLVLKEQGVLEPYKPAAAAGIPDRFKDPDGWWTGFAARARVILYNTELVKPEDAPKRIEDLTHPRFKGQVVIAKPLFGTTFTHAAALFAWNEARAKAFFQGLKANAAKVTPGNAMARKLVDEGDAAVCLTDTDDANEALLKGRPVKMVYPDQEEGGLGALVLPNTLSLIKGGPNPENGKKLIEFLLSPEVEEILAQGESAQLPVRAGVKPLSAQFSLGAIKPMAADWAEVAKRFPAVRTFIEAELGW